MKWLGIELDGIDVLYRQMEGEDKAYLHKPKKHTFVNGIAMTLSLYIRVLYFRLGRA